MQAFRLMRVLDLRKRREDEMQQRMAVATAARVRAEIALNRRIADEQSRRQELAALLSAGRTDAALVAETGRALDACARAVAAQRDELLRCQAFEDDERSLLITATVDRKALDRMRERHEQRVYREESAREAGLLNEIATARAALMQMAANLAVTADAGKGYPR